MSDPCGYQMRVPVGDPSSLCNPGARQHQPCKAPRVPGVAACLDHATLKALTAMVGRLALHRLSLSLLRWGRRWVR